MRRTSFIFIAALPLLALGWLAGQKEGASYAIPFFIALLVLWLINERVRGR